MSLATRMRYWLARRAQKASDIAFIPSWIKTSWADATFQRLTREGYKKNAAVNICLTRLSLAYQQPKPIVKSMDGEPLPTHPMQALLNRPNPQMSWKELALITAVYKGIGGNVYLKKVRSAQRLVVELWPYHIGQIRPVPGRFEWVAGYEYNDGDGDWQPIDKADIVHLKWPTVDPEQPWLALSPLISIAREVDTDNEATRYQYALLANDATPRTAIRLPSGGAGGRPATSLEVDRIKQSYRQKYGGDGRGDVAVLENGAEIERISLNMEELAFDALRRVPEARISAGFLIPPEYSGLTVGLEHSTYNNVSEARKGFFEDTIMQLLALDAGELTHDLGQDFGGNLLVEHDASQVVALQENEDAKYTRAINGWDKGLLTKNEGRRLIGLDDVPEGDGFKTASAPALPGPMDVPQIIDVTPQKRAPRRLEAKAASIETLERRFRRDVRRMLHSHFERIAAEV